MVQSSRFFILTRYVRSTCFQAGTRRTDMSYSTLKATPAAASLKSNDVSSQRRIYILGTGNIGTIVAHSLASLPDSIRPRITLLLHRKSLLDAWRKRGETLDVLRYEDGASQPRGGIDVELVEPESSHESSPSAREVEQPQEPIRHLIVSVLASQTIGALSPIKHRLDPTSTILFLQNGMGSPDEAAEQLFPTLDTRPHFMQGIVLPGGWTFEPFVVRHAARGNLPVGTIPRRGLRADDQVHNTNTESGTDSSRYLIDTLSKTPILAAEEVDYTELFQRQLEKLAINIVANPLTAILNESNAVLQQPPLAPVIRALVVETASIIRALPELKSVPGAQERFAVQRLEDRVMGYLIGVQGNTTSMCQHLRAGKKTEIQYINGYLVKRAREIGVPCELNAMLQQLILTKEAVGKGRQG